tara:strand:+ start:1172 stop:1432 length:261 start_codon:yes stop_codon:yes gene_type:complete
MFVLGDLVKRVKVLSVENHDYEWIECEFPTEEYGVIIDIEEATLEAERLNIDYPEVFIKVLWQNKEFGASWHWGDEVIVIKRAINT